MRLLVTTLALLMSILSGSAQGNSTDSPPQASASVSYLDSAKVENIGPTVFGGRVIDLAVNPANPAEFFVAYASGGLWYTKNNGTTFEPRFDNESVITIGDIDVHWDTGTIYLGSGEVNSSRSSYAGDGVYKSSNMGASWTHLGLPESHHIGRVIIDPTDPNIVNVAVLGHLYTPNTERGMYRTADGGKTWSQTLFVNENAGAVDLVVHPDNSQLLYCATWERTRRAWNFTESGSGSGIYKSIDGGLSWTKVSGLDSKFPQGEGVGRIGLAIYTDTYATIVYALLDNQDRRPEEEKKSSDALTKNDFENIDLAAFSNLEDERLQTYLDDNGFLNYTAAAVKKEVADEKIKPIALKEYVEDANRMLFDTPVIGAEVYLLSETDGTWSKTHDSYLDGLYNSYGYYFGQIAVNPKNADRLYIMGVPILRSDDGGKEWKNVNGDNVHVDHHALWINPNQPSHIINGNDGGINISYDSGDHWIRPLSPPVGQFYFVNVDASENYKVYGGTQDNGVWAGSSNYEEGVRWQMTGTYPYETIMGGDGMQVQIDSRDNSTIYTGYQFGNYFRIDDSGRTYITPKHKLGDRPYRWNWQSPILLSSHNQDIVYFGANKLLRSMDKGTTFTEISEDLTFGGKKGDVAFGTLTTISESPLQFGLIYVGTDDGRVHVTEDGGHSWTEISAGLPDSLWISRVWASAHDKDRVYVSINGYRNDVFTPYVYKSEDKGATWESITTKSLTGPVNVIKEDSVNEDILYIGTDHGVYISINRGKSYMKIGGLPTVPVHDLVTHKQSGDLLIGTHGRSIYKLDLTTFYVGINSSNAITVQGKSEMMYSTKWGTKRRPYEEALTPELTLNIFSKTAASGSLEVSRDGKTIHTENLQIPLGLSETTYDLTLEEKHVKTVERLVKKSEDNKDKNYELKAAEDGKYYLPAGAYEIIIKAGVHSAVHKLKINN